jgi:hypothetical protein
MAAATPTSEVAVANLALARLGQKAITSLDTPTVPAEDVCTLHFAMTRRRLLREYVFHFAKKYAALTKSGTVEPAFGYAGAYALPANFLRLLTLGDHTINADTPPGLYDVVENHIYTDEEDDTDTVNIQYVFDQTTVSKWDSLFVNLFRLELAKDMAYAFTLKPSLVANLDAELKDVRLVAAAVSGQEKPPRRLENSKWVAGRRRGLWRDTTRHPI